MTQREIDQAIEEAHRTKTVRIQRAEAVRNVALAAYQDEVAAADAEFLREKARLRAI